ncbi:PadR family transcriptional regulator [Micromonospora sp. C51]|uniref:PadR family transcriptional regulator n=1 Tax=Micromonospora sp. C51 TaxID=2824879 RepID=UPI0027DB985C|nr:PadR family transcriptional regulator [Micromonospora sp. C51]
MRDDIPPANVRRLDAAEFGTVSYGTVYPLITRLHRLGLVANAMQPSPNGPPRKVYRLTDTGHDRLNVWREQWTQFASVVNETLAVRPLNPDFRSPHHSARAHEPKCGLLVLSDRNN